MLITTQLAGSTDIRLMQELIIDRTLFADVTTVQSVRDRLCNQQVQETAAELKESPLGLGRETVNRGREEEQETSEEAKDVPKMLALRVRWRKRGED